MFRSSATRFRWIQNYYGEQDEWALDDIYIGQQCPNMCHGHGWCDHGHCRSAFTHRHTNIKLSEVALYYFFNITQHGGPSISFDGCLWDPYEIVDVPRAKLRSSHAVFSCRCDDGFSGTDCQPSSPLSSSVLSDFESQDALLATWQEVIGGEVVTPDMGCGVVSSGSSLYFSKVNN